MASFTNSLETDIINVLKQYPDALSFRDDTAGVDVSPQTFARVIEAFRSGKVNASYSPNNSSYDGVYNSGSDTLQIRRAYGTPERRKTVIVHEAVHCLHDLCRRRILRPYNEVGTNIAENFFRRYLLRKAGTRFSTPGGAIDKAADVVAARLEKLPRRSRIVRATDADVQKLVAALRASPVYGPKAGTKFEGNGV